MNLRLVTSGNAFKLLMQRQFELVYGAWGSGSVFPNRQRRVSFGDRRCEQHQQHLRLQGQTDRRTDQNSTTGSSIRRSAAVILRELDGILDQSASLHHASGGRRRTAYCILEQVRHAQGTLSRIGDELDSLGPGITQLWWIDPARLSRCIGRCATSRSSSNVPPLEDHYWRGAQPRTEQAAGARRRRNERLLSPAVSADHPDLHRDHAGRVRHHALRAGRPGRTPDHALPDGRGRRRGRRVGGMRARASRSRRKRSRRSSGTTASTSRFTSAMRNWLWNVVHLDLGNSYVYQDPVWDVIKSRFPDLDLRSGSPVSS